MNADVGMVKISGNLPHGYWRWEAVRSWEVDQEGGLALVVDELDHPGQSVRIEIAPELLERWAWDRTSPLGMTADLLQRLLDTVEQTVNLLVSCYDEGPALAIDQQKCADLINQLNLYSTFFVHETKKPGELCSPGSPQSGTPPMQRGTGQKG